MMELLRCRQLIYKGLGIVESRGGKGDAALTKKSLILSKGSAEERMEARSLQIQIQEIVMDT